MVHNSTFPAKKHIVSVLFLILSIFIHTSIQNNTEFNLHNELDSLSDTFLKIKDALKKFNVPESEMNFIDSLIQLSETNLKNAKSTYQKQSNFVKGMLKEANTNLTAAESNYNSNVKKLSEELEALKKINEKNNEKLVTTDEQLMEFRQKIENLNTLNNNCETKIRTNENAFAKEKQQFAQNFDQQVKKFSALEKKLNYVEKLTTEVEQAHYICSVAQIKEKLGHVYGILVAISYICWNQMQTHVFPFIFSSDVEYMMKSSNTYKKLMYHWNSSRLLYKTYQAYFNEKCKILIVPTVLAVYNHFELMYGDCLKMVKMAFLANCQILNHWIEIYVAQPLAQTSPHLSSFIPPTLMDRTITALFIIISCVYLLKIILKILRTTLSWIIAVVWFVLLSPFSLLHFIFRSFFIKKKLKSSSTVKQSKNSVEVQKNVSRNIKKK